MKVFCESDREVWAQLHPGVIKNPVVTVGSYDGVHIGHRAIIDRLNSIARQIDGRSVVVTFDPHPRKVVHNSDSSIKLLNSFDEKLALLDHAGVDNVVVIHFTEEFSRISSYDFLKKYLIDKIGVRHLVMGYNHHFGHNREGDFSYLERLKSEYGFGLSQIPKYDLDNRKVSSTVIRKFISEGDFTDAGKLLGSPYPLSGVLLRSGELLLDEPLKLLPPQGLYNAVIGEGDYLRRVVIEITELGKIRVCDVEKFDIEHDNRIYVKFV